MFLQCQKSEETVKKEFKTLGKQLLVIKKELTHIQNITIFDKEEGQSQFRSWKPNAQNNLNIIDIKTKQYEHDINISRIRGLPLCGFGSATTENIQVSIRQSVCKILSVYIGMVPISTLYKYDNNNHRNQSLVKIDNRYIATCLVVMAAM